MLCLIRIQATDNNLALSAMFGIWVKFRGLILIAQLAGGMSRRSTYQGGSHEASPVGY